MSADSGFLILDSGYQNSETTLLHRAQYPAPIPIAIGTQNRESRIQYPASRIQHPAPSTQHQAPSIQNPESGTQNPESSTQHAA